MFGSDPPPELQCREPLIRDGKPVVKNFQAIRVQGLALWNDSLLGQFHSASPPIHHILSVVNTLRGRSGSVYVIAWENGSFIFKIGNLKSKQWVMDNGPWFIS